MRKSRDFEHNMTAVYSGLIASKNDVQSFARFAARRGESLSQVLTSVEPEAYRWAIASYVRIAIGNGANLEQIVENLADEICQLVRQSVSTVNRRGA